MLGILVRGSGDDLRRPDEAALAKSTEGTDTEGQSGEADLSQTPQTDQSDRFGSTNEPDSAESSERLPSKTANRARPTEQSIAPAAGGWPKRPRIFENSDRNPEVRKLVNLVGTFSSLRSSPGEGPINLSFDNISEHVESYQLIERFGVENRMSLRGVGKEEADRGAVFRASYANQIADLIYEAVPYGRIYFRLIMAFYAASRINLNRLYFFKSILLVAAIILMIGASFVTSSLPVFAASAAGVLSLFFILVTVVYALYENEMKVNRATLTDIMSERFFHIINAEQAALHNILNDEDRSSDDTEWRDRAEVWGYAAVAFRWRIFLLKQFLDVAIHKIVRRYIWLHKFIVPVAAVFGLIVLGAFSVLMERLDGAHSVLHLLNLPGGWERFFWAGFSIVLTLVCFRFWTGNPAGVLNEVSTRIRSVDGRENDRPLDIILSLVGRVGTVKTERQR